MLLNRRAAGIGWCVAVTLFGLATGFLGCSRSPLRNVDLGSDDSVALSCLRDADCVGSNACEIRRCNLGMCELARSVTCDDGNPCTSDTCEPATGACAYRWRTGDEDRDGYPSPLPGKRPGEPDACGTDCDDSSARAHPGALESCDGVDNDCNGVVDDTLRYSSPQGGGMPPVSLVSNSAKYESLPASLTYDGENFAMTLVERNDRWQGVFHALAEDGSATVAATPLTLAANDSVAGPLIWTGSVYGTAWEDRRETSYDIYFNRLDVNGKKLHADLRVTSSAGFSIQPSLVYDGTEWLLAYADDEDTGSFSIFAQRISKDAALVGEPRNVTSYLHDARQPRLSKNSDGFGLFYFSVTEDQFYYQKLDRTLGSVGAAIPLLLNEPADASIRWNGDRYVLTWAVKSDDSMGNAIWGMAVDVNGTILAPPRPLTWGAQMARSPTVVGLGDRFVLIWADDRFSSGSYELSMQMFANDFRPIDEQQPITALGTDSIDPVGVLGGGALGVLFRSRLSGPWQSYFLALRCWSPVSR